MSLQDSIDAALALLPTDKSLVEFEGFRNQVLASGDENAALALRKIVEGHLAERKLIRNEAGKLVLHMGGK